MIRSLLPSCFSNLPLTNYQVDSRLVTPGSLFFALEGQHVDGHDFLIPAYQNGALGAVVSNKYEGDFDQFPLFRSENPLRLLQTLAGNALNLNKIRTVAVTGSVGKTSTKEWIQTLLASKYALLASHGNYNSQIGLPLTLLNQIKGEEELAVLEMGMSFKGQIKSLTEIAPPEVGVITTVALVHSQNFESLEEIAWAKSEILSHPHTRLGVVHYEIPIFQTLKKKRSLPLISFSLESSQADYGFHSTNPFILEDRIEGCQIPIEGFPFAGKHHRQNLLAAIAVARYYEVEWEQIIAALPLLKSPERRLEVVKRPEAIFINDSYNACEISVKAALETLPLPVKGGRKIAVIGSMLELGKFSDECHRQVGKHALEYVDILYCLGEECHPMVEVWKKACRPVFAFKDRSELVSCLKEDLIPEDVVLLKGSRSKEMWKIIDHLTM